MPGRFRAVGRGDPVQLSVAGRSRYAGDPSGARGRRPRFLPGRATVLVRATGSPAFTSAESTYPMASSGSSTTAPATQAIRLSHPLGQPLVPPPIPAAGESPGNGRTPPVGEDTMHMACPHGAWMAAAEYSTFAGLERRHDDRRGDRHGDRAVPPHPRRGSSRRRTRWPPASTGSSPSPASRRPAAQIDDKGAFVNPRRDIPCCFVSRRRMRVAAKRCPGRISSRS